MRVEVKIEKEYKEPLAVIHTAEVSDEVNDAIQKLSHSLKEEIVGFQGDIASILEPANIMRIYAEQQKVYAQTPQGSFLLRLRLYEAESVLEGNRFARISNSEIINLRKVDNMDLSFSGTICVKLQNNHVLVLS